VQIELKILNKGDKVLNTWENKISIKRKNGEVEIFTINLDENNLPRISPDTLLITFGKNQVSIKNTANRNNNRNDKNEDDDFEIGTF
jgi:hypothetical protein